MAVFDRLSIRVAAVGAGLCSVALTLSPGVAQAGGACYESSAGEVPAAAAAAPCAPITGMAGGVPMALPGPIPPPLAPPPIVPPLAPPPVVPPIVPPLAPPPVVPPIVPPLAPAPIIPAAGAGGLPVTTMGGLSGKGEMTGPAPSGAPVAGQPIAPGPTR
jgi:hypothetical protein